eukprot:CAMPEP_0171069894 /NCGR_PEP_ID=MMETSP0766_2-20121228/9421_1 /TAXON_ID=439317 /ORGANISM="Gambierdiscus australes, Strain CAWD 149" /LENGTH=224 /DNA_ID=CAMNT_0011526313 /DNA_START=60 /DNA_END=735 /DNA_ORIENTATION=-
MDLHASLGLLAGQCREDSSWVPQAAEDPSFEYLVSHTPSGSALTDALLGNQETAPEQRTARALFRELWKTVEGFRMDLAALFVPLVGSQRSLSFLDEHGREVILKMNKVNLELDFRIPEHVNLNSPITDEDTNAALRVEALIVQGILKAGSFVMSQTVMGITVLRLIWVLGVDPETMSFCTLRSSFGSTLWERHWYTYLSSLWEVVTSVSTNLQYRFDILWNSL